MDDIHNSIGYLLNISARLIKRNLDLKLIEFDITTSQWAILKLLSVELTLTQAQIAEKLNSDRATCGSVIDRLTNKKLVLKRMNTADRRAFDISLSQKGIDIVESLTKLASETNKQALQGISECDIETLYKVLHQIANNLEDKTWIGK
ncbi:DNA-binding MarR family transcriptional regulator [Kineothrix alysoides]|uniref:DNA-binding MarR family transcriptional regulator n=1 Tax=Kineothrix alysoides TaxID=1469948 RepID=A0A4V2QB27_9FIRM|nr:MarR family transcriptional regulator [Kineothrix alysoides]TCL54772.1 DNA-binding MarR family transcriptional regulator [Kineothrix alysoides]